MEPQGKIKYQKKIGEITFGEGFENVVSLTYIGHINEGGMCFNLIHFQYFI